MCTTLTTLYQSHSWPLHPQSQFTFTWLLGNHDITYEAYHETYDVIYYEKIQGLTGAFLRLENR